MTFKYLGPEIDRAVKALLKDVPDLSELIEASSLDPEHRLEDEADSLYSSEGARSLNTPECSMDGYTPPSA